MACLVASADLPREGEIGAELIPNSRNRDTGGCQRALCQRVLTSYECARSGESSTVDAALQQEGGLSPEIDYMNLRLLAPLAALMLVSCSGEAQDVAPPPPAVTVSQPLVQQVRDWDDYVGRFEAVQSVEVRPRATGYLQQVHFTDGQFVRAGQPLFTIDARPSRAAREQARAKIARVEA